MDLTPWTARIEPEPARGKLLLVEDDPVDMVRLRDYFGAKGYQVLAVQPIAEWERGKTDWKQVNSLAELRSIVAREQPEHILTDRHFGDAPFTGEDVAAMAHDLAPDVPIVMHTDSAATRVAREGYTVMPKTVSLLPQIDQLLQGGVCHARTT